MGKKIWIDGETIADREFRYQEPSSYSPQDYFKIQKKRLERSIELFCWQTEEGGLGTTRPLHY
jgi:hypothetical protein